MSRIKSRVNKLGGKGRGFLLTACLILGAYVLVLLSGNYSALMPQAGAEVGSLMYHVERTLLPQSVAMACDHSKLKKNKNKTGGYQSHDDTSHPQTQTLATVTLASTASTASSSMPGITRTLPTYMGGAASIVRHSGNGKIYVSTNGSYLVELSASNLSVLRTKNLAAGRAHQLTSDGTHLYVHVQGGKHKVLKIRTSDLAVVDSTPSLNGAGSPEGFVSLGGSLFVAVGGPPGKIVKVNPKDMTVVGTWSLPGGIENHGLTTDGLSLFVLGVPGRGTAQNKYFKLSFSLQLLDTITFPWTGTLGGNAYFPGNGLIYTSGGRLSSLAPKSLAIVKSAAPTDHWLAVDAYWVYRLSYTGVIQVVNPQTLGVVFIKNTGVTNLHYGIVQNDYLWVAHEVNYKYGVIGRYGLY